MIWWGDSHSACEPLLLPQAKTIHSACDNVIMNHHYIKNTTTVFVECYAKFILHLIGGSHF